MRNWIFGFFVATLLAACGGGGGGEGTTASTPPVTSAPPAAQFDLAKATVSLHTVDGRMLTLSMPTGAATALPVTADNLFDWAQSWSKGTNYGFFPGDPVTQSGVFGGAAFVYRDYTTGASIRVRTSDQAVFVLWPDKSVTQQGVLAHYTCVMNDCVNPTTAGTLTFSDVGGTSITITPNYKGSLLTWLGDPEAKKGVEVAVSDVEQVCARSARLGNWGARGGLGCNKPQADGTLRVTNIANNDQCLQLTLWTKAGQEYWFDPADPRGWQVSGSNAKLVSCGDGKGIEYGAHGYTPAKVYVKYEADKSASLVWDFGSDVLGGFGKAVFDTAHIYMFAWNGKHAGADGNSGWGLGTGRLTPAGDPIAPSTRKAWLEFKDGRYTVTFRNMTCTDKGTVTVYGGSGPKDSVVYDYGSDGYGMAWVGLPSIDSKTGQVTGSFWTAGDGVIFDPATSQLSYGAPFCTTP